MLNRLGRAEDQWSDTVGKVVLPVDGSVCGLKYIRKSMKWTKRLSAMTADSIYTSFSRMNLFSEICERQGSAH